MIVIGVLRERETHGYRKEKAGAMKKIINKSLHNFRRERGEFDAEGVTVQHILHLSQESGAETERCLSVVKALKSGVESLGLGCLLEKNHRVEDDEDAHEGFALVLRRWASSSL